MTETNTSTKKLQLPDKGVRIVAQLLESLSQEHGNAVADFRIQEKDGGELEVTLVVIFKPKEVRERMLDGMADFRTALGDCGEHIVRAAYGICHRAPEPEQIHFKLEFPEG